MYTNSTRWLWLTAAVCFSLTAHSQTLFQTTASLDINNIKAASLVHGDMWHDTNIAYGRCVFPANTNKSLAVAGGLWVAGYDNGGQLKVAAQTYRQDGTDYWPGPLTGSGSVSYATSQDWAKIWKISRSDIQTFLSAASHTTANTPAVILEWPAKGNPYAKGNNNASLTITTDMAPFIDVNADGNYNALQGDYPHMKGDQALWWVINDNGPALHTVSQTSPLGVEVHNMAYGYKRNNVLDNVLFYEYDIRNKSGIAYDSLRVGLFADMELRYGFDDYVGFDSAHRMGIVYNGSTSGAGPDSLVIAGVSLVDVTGDNCQYHAPAGSFISYNNDLSPLGNPANGAEYNNLLSAHYRLGQPLPGNARYAYPDDPSIPGGNSECAQNNTPNDKRFVISSAPVHLNGNGNLKLTYALIVDPSAHSACPQASFTGIKAIADSVWYLYCAPPPNTGIANVHTEKGALKLYPNPAQQSIFIKTTNVNGMVTVYDALGKTYHLPATQKSDILELDIRQLAPGVYTVLYRSSDKQQSGIFVKE